MTRVKLSELKHGDIFLTDKSKLLVFGWRETDGTIIAYRYTNKYYSEVLKSYTTVFKVSSIYVE